MEVFDSPFFSYLVTYREVELAREGWWGFEREAQRVDLAGDLALTPRPSVEELPGDKGQVTVDFAESQVELITPPRPSISESLDSLRQLHDRVDLAMPTERLWPFSMPPPLPPDEQIPIAVFDTSPEGQLQRLYREGLACRYGKQMQMISGLHYNFSFSDKLIGVLWQQFGKGKTARGFSDELYLAVVRNFLRNRWLLIYLFGASPLSHPSFLPDYAVSLRVSRYGYANKLHHRVSFNSLQDYIRDVRLLMNTPRSILTKGGRMGRQLNGNILQKDSEFYAAIRFKQVAQSGETHLDALENRGVKYLEVRLLDLDPFVREGISADTARFLHVFLLYCLMESWRPLSDREEDLAERNHHLVALAGRRGGLKLHDFSKGKVSLLEMASDLFLKLNEIAAFLDGDEANRGYRDSLAAEEQKLHDHSRMPSTRIIEDLRQRKEQFAQAGLRMANQFRSLGDQQRRPLVEEVANVIHP